MSSYRLVSKNINTAPYTPDSKEVDGWVYQRIDHAIEAVRARRDKLIANKRLAKEWHDKRMAHMDELIEAEESTMDD